MRENILYVLPTVNCNLSCPHCDVKSNIETYNRELFLQRIKEFHGEIALFGGEITYYKDRMFDIIDACKDNPRKIRSVSTNLIKLDDDLIEFYKKLGMVGTSWNTDRFNEKEYQLWYKNCTSLKENNIQYTVLVTLTPELINMNIHEFISLCKNWNNNGTTQLKLENLIYDELKQEHFEQTDEWLCELYKQWNLPMRNEIFDRILNWKYNCYNVYSIYPDGTIKNGCPHNEDMHILDKCLDCKYADVCQPCRLQRHCSFPKKLYELIKNKV